MAEVVQQRIIAAPPHELVRILRAPENWLEEAAAEAGRGGQAVDARMRGELGRGGVTVEVGKRVRFEVGSFQRVRDRFVVPVTWEAAGYAGLFPVMDALIELHPEPEGRTRLLFWGRYDPPLGRVGDLVDRLVANRTAEATVSALLDAIEHRAENQASDVPADLEHRRSG